MSAANALVVAVFDDNAVAESAINDLRNTGFSNDEILYSSRQKRGGFFENLKSWITGEETASIGDVAKNLKDMGVPDEAANYYARERDAGHPIIAVSSPGHEQNARNVLSRHGGHSHDVTPGSTTAGMGPGAMPSSAGMGPGAMPSTAHDQPPQTAGYQPAEGYRQPDQPISQRDRPLEGEEARIPLREEQLNVEKQKVQKGEVRVHKEVVTEQQRIDVPVSHEEVVIEHLPASEARAADTPIGQSETIRIPVSEEQVNVTKQTVETGEIDVKKRDVQGEQRVTGTVRREEPRIEKSGDVNIRRDDDVRPGRRDEDMRPGRRDEDVRP
ncbi:MAG TPA: YsnF/AvaK domain-containing protein [Ktedonobacteraceae bacterium]|jgi:uncharacterized protein (TIGR02271 family)